MVKNSVIVKCENCGDYLIPYGNTFLHANVESECEVSGWITININVSKSYEDKLGTPDVSFNDMVDRLAYLELSWLKRAIFRFKAWLNSSDK